MNVDYIAADELFSGRQEKMNKSNPILGVSL